MKMNWGVKITILYSGFVLMMITLVVASMRQKFELVSDDYYKQEIAYQDVIDASHNQAKLSSAVSIKATDAYVTIAFPDELNGHKISGNVQFYSPAHAQYDKQFEIATTGNIMNVARSLLHNTAYKVKLSYTAAQKTYYQESDLSLN